MRANTALLDGEVAGMIGVAKHPEWGLFFAYNTEDLQPHLSSVTIWRCIKDVMKIVDQYSGPVISQASCVEGCINLNRLGFFHLHGPWYGWPRSP